MKVVVSGYVGKRITGIGRNLVSLLSHSGGDIGYVVYANEDMAAEFEGIGSNVEVRIYGVSSQNSLGNLLWTTFVFPFKVAKERADVALIPNFTLLLFKLRPTVTIMHDLIEFNVPGKFSPHKMFYRTKIADPLMARRSDHIVTVSKNSKRDLVSILGVPEEKVTVVYDGVDRTLFRRMDADMARRVLVGRNLPESFLLCAGTVDHPGKNAYTLVKAFERLCEHGYEGGLVLAGMPGSGYEVVEEEIESSSFRDRIHVTGYVSDDELVALYSTCDVFCFLSLYEGFGMPPLEALACGAKVVVSDRSSLPEVVGECGWLVDPLDLNGIVGAVDEALASEMDFDLVKRHLSKFDWTQLSQELEMTLTQAIMSDD